jgi:tetratricopeptide (TPR) repeat protein/DNA-binding SARP family transcriptional activator
METLVDRVWDDAPAGARRALQVYITRIRRLLERVAAHDGSAPRLVRRSGGYLLESDVELVDLQHFQRLTRSASTAAAATDSELLSQARTLWRGDPLTGVGGRWATQVREDLRQQYLDVTVAWARAEMLADRPAVVLGPLTDLAGRHPFAEPLAVVLLRALHAAGRPAEALQYYARIREQLAAELGTDPSSELQAVHQAILRGELCRPAATHVAAGTPVVPSLLPPADPGFAGRVDHLQALNALVVPASNSPSHPTLVCAVSGAAGVGKTTLVVHWAHTMRAAFPDGQLYLNLRGFAPGGQVMEPAEAVRVFLGALGVPPERVPATMDAQVGLYRTLVAGKRILVVLDNARDAEQARPLLPGTPTALTIVTSRDKLTGMLALDNAQPLALDVLSSSEARDLLTYRLGHTRIAAEPDAVHHIITACARLPLALAIAAARARQTGFRLDVLAAQLGDAEQRLDALDAGDPASQVRAVFSWSVAALSPAVGRLFRLLGLHPGLDISVAAAVSLDGRPGSATRRSLDELARANLIVEHLPHRYTFHDLLRSYARDLAHDIDDDATRRAATTRLLDHYLHTAHAADRLLSPARDPIDPPLTPAATGVCPERLADHAAAKAWLAAEHTVLLATLRNAMDADPDTRTSQLAWTLDMFLYRAGHWHDQVAAWRAVAKSAERLSDARSQADAHRRIAHAATHLGHHPDAHTHLQRALALSAHTTDRVLRARIHFSLAYHWLRQDHPAQALRYVAQALHLYQLAGHRQGRAHALNGVGLCHARLGRHPQALTHCTLALTLFQELGDRDGQADTWQSLGYIHHHLDQHAKDVDCYQRAIALYGDLGDRYNEADTWAQLGDVHHADGDLDAARTAWSRALRLFTSLGHRDAEAVQSRLAAVRTHRPSASSGSRST